MTRYLVTPRSIGRNLRWLWRWKIWKAIARPSCSVCGSSRPAEVYYAGRWWCRSHPLMVPARAVGSRPKLRVYTKRQARRLFEVPAGRERVGWFGAAASTTADPIADLELGRRTVDTQIANLNRDAR